MVTVNNDERISIYGQKVIKEGAYIWKVKISSFSGYGDVPYIGIFENDDRYLDDYLGDCDFEDYGYQLCGGDGDLCRCLPCETNYEALETCVWKQDGDIIAMKLDLDHQTLSASINDAAFIQLFSNIQITPNGYRLALGVEGCSGSKFQLL